MDVVRSSVVSHYFNNGLKITDVNVFIKSFAVLGRAA